MQGEPDGHPHRPQSKSGHRSRRSGKPTGSVCRSSPLPSCVLQLAPLSPAQAATTTRGRPQLRPQDWIRSQTRDRRPFAGARHPLRPHVARSSSAGHRWSAARDTSWLILITSSGRHIMRRSVRQAPSAASTRPPRQTAATCASATGVPTRLCDRRCAGARCIEGSERARCCSWSGTRSAGSRLGFGGVPSRCDVPHCGRSGYSPHPVHAYGYAPGGPCRHCRGQRAPLPLPLTVYAYPLIDPRSQPQVL